MTTTEARRAMEEREPVRIMLPTEIHGYIGAEDRGSFLIECRGIGGYVKRRWVRPRLIEAAR